MSAPRHGLPGSRGIRLAGAAAAFAALLLPSAFLPIIDPESLNVLFSHEAFGTWQSLALLGSPSYFSAFGEGGYRPLTTLCYFLVHAVSGADPLGYKLLKLGLHAANSGLVFALSALLLRDRTWALLAAGHYFLRLAFPAFEGTAFLPDILAAFFCLAASLVHLKAAQDKRSWSPFLTALLFACGLLAKEMSVFLPAVLLGHDLLLLPSRDRSLKALLARHWPTWAVLAGFLSLLTWGVAAQGFYGSIAWSWPQDPWLPAKLLAGYGLTYLDPSGLIPSWVLVLALALPASWLFIRGKSAAPPPPWRGLAFLFLWLALSLLPVLNALPFPKFLSYFRSPDPRFLALGGAGLAMVPALLACWPGQVRPARLLLGLLMLSGMCFQAWDTVADRRPWTKELSATARIEFGLAQAGRGARSLRETPLLETRFSRLLLSLPQLERRAPAKARIVRDALTELLPPEDSRALLGFFGRRDFYDDPAQSRLAAWFLMSPDLDSLLGRIRGEETYRRASKLLASGAAGAALPELELALRFDPGHYPACYSFSHALLLANRPSRAWSQAAQCDDLWLATLNRGPAETSRRRPDQTIASQAALAGADRLARERRYALALKAYREVAAAVSFPWPEHWAALREAGFLQAGARQAHDSAMDSFHAGRTDAALQGFQKAAALAPRFGAAYVSSAALKAGKGDRAGALRDCDAALAQPLTSSLKALVLSTRKSIEGR
ncbi:MAG: hypothetical protein HY924_14710 [Elusimicrobia bacterium]|nr:hypothetical protein [Elusimicrobiota bacterium]